MKRKYFWEAVRSNGKISRGYADSPEEARLYQMPDDQDFVFVPRTVLPREGVMEVSAEDKDIFVAWEDGGPI